MGVVRFTALDTTFLVISFIVYIKDAVNTNMQVVAASIMLYCFVGVSVMLYCFSFYIFLSFCQVDL
jgi:hypothetical protein